MGREFMTQIKAVEKVGGSLPSATKQFVQPLGLQAILVYLIPTPYKGMKQKTL